MAIRLPVVRHFIACEDVEPSQDGRQYTLRNLVHAIRPLPGEAYPCLHPEVCLFVLMTDVYEQHRIRVELVFWHQPADETSIYTTREGILNLGSDPLIVHGLPIRLRNLLFPNAGLYEFRLWCDGQIIARETILLREEN